MTISIEQTGIVIRPSSVDSFFTCSYQWGKVFLEGMTSIPNARAAIGTSIHAGAEVLWSDAIRTGKLDTNLTKLNDAAIDAWTREAENGMQFDEGENKGTAISTILQGVEAFVEDIAAPGFVRIPEAVEKRYTIPIAHQIVSSISGTVDYIGHGIIADIKTSKRKPVLPNYVTQQSIYKLLAEANGVTVNASEIHGVVLKKAVAEGSTLDMTSLINVAQAKKNINMILDTIDILAEDKIAPELIMRPNPKHYLCSPKYCKLHGKCPATSEAKKTVIAGVRL